MKFVVICLILISASCVLSDEKYESKYPFPDLKAILSDESLLNSYVLCFTEGKECTPEGEELRNILPEAISTGCAKCTDELKARAKVVASFLIKERPELWEKLVHHLDPDKTYRNQFKDQLKAQGFDV